MTRTAKRRWSRELENEVDGIAFGASGPVLLHGYDPPAGGKWIDDVIPGKLGALDRNTGEVLWLAPCEVGYGRGFGAGVGDGHLALVLGPSTAGHRIVRMSLANGELSEAAEIAPFDEAHVAPDACICANAGRVFAVDPAPMTETWEYSRDGERYHHIDRAGALVLVVYTQLATGLQGVLLLDVATGEPRGTLVLPERPVIHQIAATGALVTLLTRDVSGMLPPEDHAAFAVELATHPGGGSSDTLSLITLRVEVSPPEPPLWHRILDTERIDQVPEVSISADSGKVYLVRGAYLEVLDALSGRLLGEWAVPGLDEQVAWSVVDGAGLLAEERRISIFELPA